MESGMMMKFPIPLERLNQKSISDRFWGSDPKQNFYARAKNLVISGNLNRSMFLEIQNEYGGNIFKDFAVQWKELLEEITFQMAVDGMVDHQEKVFFKEYIAIFQIASGEASRIYRTGARRACLKLLQDIASDNCVGELEFDRVQQIAMNFGLKEFDVHAHRANQVKKLVQARFDDITSDLMISDCEWEEFEFYCRDMKVDLDITPEFQKTVAKGRKLWSVRYGKLDPISVQHVKFKTDEIAYLVAQAKWYEMRMQRGESYQKLIRSGMLCLTNERVIMISDTGDNQSIKWKAIHSVVELSSACFELEKIKGKAPTIIIQKTDDITWLTAAIVADRLCSGRI